MIPFGALKKTKEANQKEWSKDDKGKESKSPTLA